MFLKNDGWIGTESRHHLVMGDRRMDPFEVAMIDCCYGSWALHRPGDLVGTWRRLKRG